MHLCAWPFVPCMNTTVHIAPPCSEPVRTVYSDEHILIIDKPSGLLSVPGRHPQNKDCMIHRVQTEHPSAQVVHRLDMDTSGLMVVALTPDSHRHLSKQFEARATHKTYIARVFGTPTPNTGTIDAALICDWPNRPKQKVCEKTGKPAQTHYDVIAHNHQEARVKLTPVTGRSHQLRVHLAHIGHPILGCAFYAHEQAFNAAHRLMLHAHTLGVTHPDTGHWMTFESEPPF